MPTPGAAIPHSTATRMVHWTQSVWRQGPPSGYQLNAWVSALSFPELFGVCACVCVCMCNTHVCECVWEECTARQDAAMFLPRDFAVTDIQASLGHHAHASLWIWWLVAIQVVNIRILICDLKVANHAVSLQGPTTMLVKDNSVITMHSQSLQGSIWRTH